MTEYYFTPEQEKVIRLMNKMGEAAGILRQKLWEECMNSPAPPGAPPSSDSSLSTPCEPSSPSPNCPSSAVGSLPVWCSGPKESSLRLLAQWENFS